MPYRRTVVVPDTAWFVFILCIAGVFLLWGFFKELNYFYAAWGVAPIALFFRGKTTISPEYIERESSSGTWSINWNEITDIEVLPNFYWVVFNGKNRRLAIIGPAFLNFEKDGMPAEHIAEIAAQRGIPVRLNLLAFLKHSKGTQDRPGR